MNTSYFRVPYMENKSDVQQICCLAIMVVPRVVTNRSGMQGIEYSVSYLTIQTSGRVQRELH